MSAPGSPTNPLDLLGVGVGPFNLSLAALADGVPELTSAFLERTDSFRWHPGLLIEGASLQVPFLADLVTLVEPASPWSFLRYLRERERLFPFYFAERFHIERAEYDAYCRWVSQSLPSCRFGREVETVRWDARHSAFEVEHRATDGDRRESLYARNLALGVGTAPQVPDCFRELVEDPELPVLHSADYLEHRTRLLGLDHVTVVGSGQSGAEVFLDLLRRRPHGRENLDWLARTPAFAPMEYSKLGLEQFTPDYTRYFHGLDEETRDALLPRQWQLYKGVSEETLGDIHQELYHRSVDGGWPAARLTPGVAVCSARRSEGRLTLKLEHAQQGTAGELATDAVVLATGYTERPLAGLLHQLWPQVLRDRSDRPRVDAHHRLELDGGVTGSVYVQNAERHTHGPGAPDLGLAAWRSAVILNHLSGRAVYPLPRRTAFTSFGWGG
ncbi:SidA/IucD/PvdA family monooxygenase [Streptomyces sp. NPDC005438]|uniref:lysine N(6)-hydroxylase/L-ornithine N(5)-oxygenase family protein n=1 Tax=Streptomyces sp. NPDC005438 TaxID=3156880 RepID=UPI0033B32AE8